MSKPINTVAIIGGGPTGSALAFHLCKAGKKVVLFERRTVPPVTVGESLVPATIPFIRELGIEEEVRAYSTFKPGATFVFNEEESLSFSFAGIRGAATEYSYNVPRDKFDLSVERVAEKTGALIVREAARVERVGSEERVRLAEESIAATEGFLKEQPDLIVDATGRVRLLPNLLRLPFKHGSRRDTALFAHCEGVNQVIEGNVHTDILERGWAWRIPLPGKMSIGLVIDSDHIKTFGSTSEEQFDNYLKHDPITKLWGPDPKRVTPVLKYTNYQLCSERGYGDGWVLCGDTFGFVDPVLSSGLLMAFDSAKALATAIIAGGGETEMKRYEKHVIKHLGAWHQTIDHFYSGRLFTLFKVGENVKETIFGKLLNLHFQKHLPRVFTGEATTSRYSVWLVDFMCKHGLMEEDPTELRVR
ncbi:MAG: tryptophan 7-halogenase [Deltaproteobacteria bacterium]|nr:tryptophan 7-halogenase [Deltaproteobacteria bacterium]